MKDILTIIDRFFDGETSLDEERLLYEYFAGTDIPDDLLPLKPMFLDLQAIAPTPVTMARPTAVRPLRRQWTAVAATVTAVIGLSVVLHFGHRSDYELCVYGKTYTDKAAVMREVDRTMTSAVDHTPDIDSDLRQAFGNN
jgi:hypothetical protein